MAVPRVFKVHSACSGEVERDCAEQHPLLSEAARWLPKLRGQKREEGGGGGGGRGRRGREGGGGGREEGEGGGGYIYHTGNLISLRGELGWQMLVLFYLHVLQSSNQSAKQAMGLSAYILLCTYI